MQIKLQRQKLYEEVWRTPIGTLSRNFGVTAAKIREACATMKIPLPPVGHWSLAKAGIPPAPSPLGPHDGPDEVTIDAKEKESLAEWARRDSESIVKAPRPSIIRQGIAATKPASQPRLVPLREWAAIVFGVHAPHPSTLLRWVHEGRIQPQPRRIGRTWWVAPAADYRGD